jgi:hypothetical protein
MQPVACVKQNGGIAVPKSVNFAVSGQSSKCCGISVPDFIEPCFPAFVERRVANLASIFALPFFLNSAQRDFSVASKLRAIADARDRR